MTNYYLCIEIPDGKVKEIMDRLNRAQEEIGRCYDELKLLGVVVIKANPAPGKDAGQEMTFKPSINCGNADADDLIKEHDKAFKVESFVADHKGYLA